MTISTTNRKAGPFAGNGVTTAFPFVFKVLAAADLVVVKTSTSGVDTTLVLDSNYTVGLNSDQDTAPGGIVTYATLATGEKLTITSNMAATQPTDITNGSGFYASVIEQALDRIVIAVQQLLGKADRSIRFPISDSITPSELPTASVRAGKALIFGPTGDVGLSSTPFDDQAAAAAASAAAAAASATSAASSQATASAANASAVTSATSATASALSASNDAATVAVIYDTFDDRYLGPKNADPATDNDGNPLLNGALYFNSSTNATRAYSVSLGAWQPAVGAVIRYGTGSPSNALGSDGDFYIDQLPHDLYGPKSGGVWPTPTSLVGPNGPGTGNVIGPASSITDEIALFNGTTGQLLKRSTGTGLPKLTSGKLSIATAGAGGDYVPPGSATASGLTLATGRLLGRTTAGAGAIEEISVGSGLSLIDGILAFAGSVGNHEVTVYGGNGAGSTNTRIRRFTTILTNVGSAITYADSSTLGASFTVNEAGVYAIIFTDVLGTGSPITFGASVNSAQLTTSIESINVANRLSLGSDDAAFTGSSKSAVAVIRLAPGDIVRPHVGSSAGASNNPLQRFTIVKVNT